MYQDPEQAWCLVKAREIVEGRRVPPEVFVDQFLKSQAVVSELKQIFKDQIDIIFMEKNLDGTREKPFFNVIKETVAVQKAMIEEAKAYR